MRASAGATDGATLVLQQFKNHIRNGLINVLLAGLRSSGRHGDGCGVVASPMCCVEGLEVGGGGFAASGFGTARPRKIVRREGSTALSLIVTFLCAAAISRYLVSQSCPTDNGLAPLKLERAY